MLYDINGIALRRRNMYDSHECSLDHQLTHASSFLNHASLDSTHRRHKITNVPRFVAFMLLMAVLLALHDYTSLNVDTAAHSSAWPLLGVAATSFHSGLTGMQFTPTRLLELRETVREMFHHGYDSYLRYAFPHDELKPITRTWTDSLSELGNSKRRYDKYHGVALTLVDSLSSLAVLGNRTEFQRAVDWVGANVSFDVDVRVNLFEANIRLLGGLLSAHMLAIDPALHLHPSYDGSLLRLAKDLGDRFLPAFETLDFSEEVAEALTSKHPRKKTTGRSAHRVQLPYAWINLKHGVEPDETKDQCTAGIGTLLLEMGLLSHLTNDHTYYDVAERALFELWDQRNVHTNLVGNSLNSHTGEWTNTNAGIGAGIDSFYEYLLKSYLMFDNVKFLHMWQVGYEAVLKFLKYDKDWYVESDMTSGSYTHVQFNSLAGFWPGLQSLIGDFSKAIPTHYKHYSLWQKFDGIPERYLLQQQMIHSSEKHYILRPEVIESTYYLYRATKDSAYLEMGYHMLESLQKYARVAGGFASIHDLESKKLEDRMHSFFLSETLKYLYLLFDENNWVHSTQCSIPPQSVGAATGSSSSPHHTAAQLHAQLHLHEDEPQTCMANGNVVDDETSGKRTQYIFTTEGHLFPILSSLHQRFGDASLPQTILNEAEGKVAPKDVESVLASTTSRSKYSLFNPYPNSMNQDTRAYFEQWSKRGSKKGKVDFGGLARQAHCPAIPEKYQARPFETQHKYSEFYRLARIHAVRSQTSQACWVQSVSPSNSNSNKKKGKKGASTRFHVHPPSYTQGDFSVHVNDGAFLIRHFPSDERIEIRNLGTKNVEITNVLPLGPAQKPAGGISTHGFHPTYLEAYGFSAVQDDMEDNFLQLSKYDQINQWILRPVVLEKNGKVTAHKLTTHFGSLTQKQLDKLQHYYESNKNSHATHGVDSLQQSGAIFDEKAYRKFERKCIREWDGIGPFFGPDPSPLFSPLHKPNNASAEDVNATAAAAAANATIAPAATPIDFSGFPRFSTYNTSSFLLANLVLASPIDGCKPPAGGGNDFYAGRIVLVERGGCTFIDKLMLAQAHGAAAVVVINNEPDVAEKYSTEKKPFVAYPPSAAQAASSTPPPPMPLRILMMGIDHSQREVLIPSMMIPYAYGKQIMSCAKGWERIQNEMHKADAQFHPQPFQAEMVKYYIPPTSLTSSFTTTSSSATAAAEAAATSRSKTHITPSSASLHPLVVGDLSQFYVTSMGGFTVEIQEHNSNFILKVY